MKKISFVLAFVMILGCVLASCGGRSYKAFKVDPNYQSDESDNPNRSVQNLDGTKITVPKDIKSIVCFSPEAAVILRGLGASKYVKAIDEATSAAVAVNNVIGLEDMEASEPDIIFIAESYDPASVLSGSVPYVTVPSVMTITDTKNLITLCEKVIDYQKESLATAIDNQMNIAGAATNEYANKYPVFVDLGSFSTSGGGTYVNEIINVCGGENVFASANGFTTVTAEDIVKANPTFIFTTDPVNTYRSNPAFRELEAVKEGHVYQIEARNIKYATQSIADVIVSMYETINSVHTSGK